MSNKGGAVDPKTKYVLDEATKAGFDYTRHLLFTQKEVPLTCNLFHVPVTESHKQAVVRIAMSIVHGKFVQITVALKR